MDTDLRRRMPGLSSPRVPEPGLLGMVPGILGGGLTRIAGVERASNRRKRGNEGSNVHVDQGSDEVWR